MYIRTFVFHLILAKCVYWPSAKRTVVSSDLIFLLGSTPPTIRR